MAFASSSTACIQESDPQWLQPVLFCGSCLLIRDRYARAGIQMRRRGGGRRRRCGRASDVTLRKQGDLEEETLALPSPFSGLFLVLLFTQNTSIYFSKFLPFLIFVFLFISLNRLLFSISKAGFNNACGALLIAVSCKRRFLFIEVLSLKYFHNELLIKRFIKCV